MKYTEGLSIFCPFDSGAQFMIFATLLHPYKNKGKFAAHISGAKCVCVPRLEDEEVGIFTVRACHRCCHNVPPRILFS